MSIASTHRKYEIRATQIRKPNKKYKVPSRTVSAKRSKMDTKKCAYPKASSTGSQDTLAGSYTGNYLSPLVAFPYTKPEPEQHDEEMIFQIEDVY